MRSPQGRSRPERKKRCCLYLRVSSGQQSVQQQEDRLLEVAERNGWEVIGVFEEQPLSGSLARDKRPQLDAAIRAAISRKYDILMVWSVDRLGRSLLDLISTLRELTAANVDLYIDRQAIDTTTPSGKAMFGMLGIFAEFERDILRERTLAGLDRARQYGTRSGKMIGHPFLAEAKVAKVRELVAAGLSISKVAKETGVSPASVKRIKSGNYRAKR